MTVLRPSLPPVSSMTTSTVSFREASAARAVLARNWGTMIPTARREVPRREWITNWRRSSMVVSSYRSGQLILGHRHNRMDGFAHAPIQGLLLGRSLGQEGN